jgi:hypothetical protein
MTKEQAQEYATRIRLGEAFVVTGSRNPKCWKWQFLDGTTIFLEPRDTTYMRAEILPMLDAIASESK